ncbi:MAG: ribonuclease E/G, partial [Candidatus Marinimicrobia bacterium]|nr:ribonuclease E/G [Candidatus Neomarinimicrobiota bacterium]
KKKSNQYGNISVDLQTDQDIFVQVIKEPFASKGPRVTTEVAIPGRLLVLVPGTNYVGISKKIWDKYERRRLEKIIISLKEKGFGIIIRTVAESKSEDTIRNDYKMLMKHWLEMDQKSKKAQAPALVYQDLETASSIIRDLLTPDIEKIIIDSKKLFRKLQSYLDDVSPNLSAHLERYKIKAPLFESMGIEDEIAKLL